MTTLRRAMVAKIRVVVRVVGVVVEGHGLKVAAREDG